MSNNFKGIHYTSKENVEAIQKEGIKPSTLGAYGPGAYVTTENQDFYATSKASRGNDLWGGDSESKQTGIVYFEVPDSKVIHPDPSRPDIYVIPDGVPPENITLASELISGSAIVDFSQTEFKI